MVSTAFLARSGSKVSALGSLTITGNADIEVHPGRDLDADSRNAGGARFFLDGEQLIVALGQAGSERMFAVDAGSTEGVAKTIAANNLQGKVHGGGFDLLPTTLDAIKKGDLEFTIDQQPYLQGFYTVMVLFMYKISGGLSGPADINTGLKFVTKTSVDPYLSGQNRYEGSSAQEKVLTRSGAI